MTASPKGRNLSLHRPVPDAAEHIQVEDAGVPVIQRSQQNSYCNNGPDVNPFRWIEGEIETKSDNGKDGNRESVTDVHCALIKARLRLEANTAVRAMLVHHIEAGEVRSGIGENSALTTAWAFTAQ